MTNTKLSKTWKRLSSIAACAKRDKTFEFTSLAHLLDESFLKDCYYHLARNKAVGIDRVRVIKRNYYALYEGNLHVRFCEGCSASPYFNNKEM